MLILAFIFVWHLCQLLHAFDHILMVKARYKFLINIIIIIIIIIIIMIIIIITKESRVWHPYLLAAMQAIPTFISNN